MKKRSTMDLKMDTVLNPFYYNSPIDPDLE